MRGQSARFRTLGLAAAVIAGIVLLVLLWPRDDGGDPADATATAAERSGGSGAASDAPAGPGARGGRATTVTAAKTTGGDGAGHVAGPVIAAGWGAGLFELGRERPQEGNPEAPMSLSVAPDGTTLVLDQVNGRIVRYSRDGVPTDSMQVTLQGPQDIVVGRDGTTVVLDRLVDKSIAVMNKDGRLLGELPV
ncbi:MAG: hypothetical protein ACK4N5_15265, partial [Myxococcales bacterium]